jgi:hypothetical protein
MRRRFRPRFTLRTLAIFVTLVCAYFAAWEVTKRFGVGDVAKSVNNPVFVDQSGLVMDNVAKSGSWPYFEVPRSPAPFVITVNRYDSPVVDPFGNIDRLGSGQPTRKTYLWFFGFIFPRNTITLAITPLPRTSPPHEPITAIWKGDGEARAVDGDKIRERIRFFRALRNQSAGNK